jgi:hypothetical protein
MPTNSAQATKVVTGVVRLSYVHVFEPWSNSEDQPERYSVTLLIPKTDKATLNAIKKAQEAALEQGKSKVFSGKIPANWKSTLHDGDEEADLEKNPECAGHMMMAVASKTKPGVVDRNLNPIIDSTEIYSGCYARVSINAFPYNTSGNRGVSFGLNHIMKWADGDYLGGRSRAEDDFADIAELESAEDEALI